jgi:hypothetical protein
MIILMPVDIDHYTCILKYWRAIEIFTLLDIPVRNRNDHSRSKHLPSAMRFKTLKPRDDLPWVPGLLPPPREGKQWKHTLYFHLVSKEAVAQLLARLTGSAEFREPVGGYTCLSALVIDQQGVPAERTYTPSAFVYGIKVIRERRDPEELPLLLGKAQEELYLRFKVEPARAIGWDQLQHELDHLGDLINKQLPSRDPLLCVSEEVAVGSTAEAPFLNSPYLHDLNHLLKHPQELGSALSTFLAAQVDTGARTDLLDQRVLLEQLHPQHMSPGRWPSDPAHGLYTCQQAALNIALSTLRDNPRGAGQRTSSDSPGMAGITEATGRGKTSTHDSPGLLGINGPPGTGKTTLLRDVVADTVVSRARRLLEADVTQLFGNKRYPIYDIAGYYRPDPAVFTSDGIVVSGNNNTAIENISKELPALSSIDPKTFKAAEYFSITATHVFGRPCWAMLSAVLGRSDNRNTFVGRWWFGKAYNFRRFLKEQYEDERQSRENLQHYEATARELKGLLSEFERFRTLASEYHAGFMARRAAQLLAEFDIPSRNLPDGGWASLPLEKIHALTPYSSEKLNILRSEIFLRSLELQEWAIRVNARYFNSNLNAFVDLIGGKLGSRADEQVVANLWNCFFFCIPVVSVTLASFQRQFPKMGQSSIGWLLLDEAGQATLPSVCGAVWRSRRCIVIGDTRQIPPVVTIPDELERLLRNAYGVNGDGWSPLRYSAQSLADRGTLTGTYIRLGSGAAPVWTGIPLRLHRRCSEPMFSIANSIAYGGQMVNVLTADPVEDFPTSPSGWIDVEMMTALDGHVVAEELQILNDLLTQLAFYPGMIFVISPFRSVAGACQERFFQKDRIECGTIHTFQGKEAGIVILILGTHPRHTLAREWVAATPNMLNVAVTRAKRRLYVIGSRRLWAGLPHFNVLAASLPVKEHFSGRLF